MANGKREIPIFARRKAILIGKIYQNKGAKCAFFYANIQRRKLSFKIMRLLNFHKKSGLFLVFLETTSWRKMSSPIYEGGFIGKILHFRV